MFLGTLLFGLVEWGIGLYLLVQFILALGRRRNHRSWSFVWLIGCAFAAVGIFGRFAALGVLSFFVVSGLLLVFLPTALWIIALVLFLGDRNRQKAAAEALPPDPDQPEGVWPPAPKP